MVAWNVRDEITEQIIFTNADLLVRTFLLMDWSFQPLERMKRQHAQRYNASNRNQRHERASGSSLPQPQHPKSHLDAA